MVSDTDREKLKELEAKIAAAKGEEPEKHYNDEHHAQVQHGWRMVTELVAGLLIGFGIGYGLDTLLGTLPIMLVLFTLLGFVAGIRVMMRTAAEMQRDDAARAAQDERD